MELEENRQIIYVAQRVAGKILMLKSLEARSRGPVPKMGRMRVRRTVRASTMIADREFLAQGQMSHGNVETGA